MLAKYLPDNVCYGRRVSESFVITNDHIIAKGLVLGESVHPQLAQATLLSIHDGVNQTYVEDFVISGTSLSWDGLGLESILQVGDKVNVLYWTGSPLPLGASGSTSSEDLTNHISSTNPHVAAHYLSQSTADTRYMAIGADVLSQSAANTLYEPINAVSAHASNADLHVTSTLKSALSAAASPSGTNPFATVADLTAATPNMSGWESVTSFTRTDGATFTVTNTAENAIRFMPRTALRYRASAGTWAYGVVNTYTSGTVTILGAPLEAAYTEMSVDATGSKTTVFHMSAPGDFAASASTTILLTSGKTYESWELRRSALVSFKVRLATAYGTTAPQINVVVSSNVVSPNAVAAVASDWTRCASVNTSYYMVNPGDNITLTTTQGTGTAGDTLTVTCIAVTI